MDIRGLPLKGFVLDKLSFKNKLFTFPISRAFSILHILVTVIQVALQFPTVIFCRSDTLLSGKLSFYLLRLRRYVFTHNNLISLSEKLR